jgi:anti-sigma factor RsiW
MNDAHADEWLIDHVRGELDPADGARVDAHLAACDACRASRERFGALMTELARTAPAPPPMHWGAYRAQLRERLERRTSGSGGGIGRGRGALWAWVARPLPALVAAGLVALLVMTGLPGGVRAPDPLALDNTILASQLDMIARLDVVQQLDLLEDFNVIGDLDELAEPRKS